MARYPDNTLPAFEHALTVGADVLELDLQETVDKDFVLHHDARVNAQLCDLGADSRHRPKRPKVVRMTAAELQRLECPGGPNERFPRQQKVPGTRLSTLGQFLGWLAEHPNPRARQVELNIEIKTSPLNPGQNPKRMVARVLETLRAHQMEARTILQSFDPRILRAARDQSPTIRTALLFAAPEWPIALKLARENRVQILSPDYRSLTPARMKRARAAGYQVIPYTPNTPEDWKRLIELGVDGIITDDPEGLTRMLKP